VSMWLGKEVKKRFLATVWSGKEVHCLFSEGGAWVGG
jgi:hypothetical protein